MLHSEGVFDLQVLFMFDREGARRHWNPGEPPYPHRYLGRYVRLHKYSVLHLHPLRALKNGRYDVVFIPCHNDLTALTAAAYATAHDIPLVYCADSVRIHPLFDVRSRLRDGLVKFLLRKSKAVWVPGLASQEYMLHYGVPPSRIFQGSYTLDVDSLLREMETVKRDRTVIRRSLGIADGATVFLMVANMLENRRHALLLDAF
jgi:glycosyltransferase involved in cell wall biosynthesis